MSLTRRKFLTDSAKVAGVAAAGVMVPGIMAQAAPVPKKWDMETDVIVVGFGGAGASAAIGAADGGAKVLILEKQVQATHYPNTRMSGGIVHSASADYNYNALKQYALAMFSGQNLPWKLEGEEDPEYAEAFAGIWADNLPSLEVWLKSIDSQWNPRSYGGPAFPDFPGAKESGYKGVISSFSGVTKSRISTKDMPYLEKEYGEALFALLSKGVNDRKDVIKVQYESPAKDLIMNDNGEVVGVVAENKGKRVNYKAKKAVILTCGGYEYNKSMRKAFLEGQGVEGWAFYGTLHNTGDGIEMAMKAGAGLAKVGKAASRFIGATTMRHNGLKIGFITQSIGTPNTMVVNNYGKRFLAENLITEDPSRYFAYKEAVRFDIQTLRYDNNPAWFIMDQTVIERGPLTQMNVSTAGYGYIPWSNDNQDAINRGWVLKADTVEELGEKIKAHNENKAQMNPQTLAAEVKRFNEFCAAGEDKDFGRKTSILKPVERGPFYAMPLYAGGPNTKGGIKCNPDRQVVQWSGAPIPRLYSAGEISSVLKFVYQGGGNLTECMIMGRLAGANAAKLSNVK